MKYRPADLSSLTLTDLDTRPSKVETGMLAKPWVAGGSFESFLNSLPKVLASDEMRNVANAVIQARKTGRPVIMAMGAHVIKVGLSPLLIDAMKNGIITGFALNGAGIIHDSEMALSGHTSEDVAQALADGSFGTARQTAEFIAGSLKAFPGEGLGRAVGLALNRENAPYKGLSLLASAAELDIPVTVHVTQGADIIHQQPSFDPEATARAGHLDFRLLVSMVGDLKGGVYFNTGSAVVLPEVFLKAINAARNLGMEAKDFTAVNLDMIRHYRPMTNVVQRPVMTGGRGIFITGHHEINLPLILAMVKEGLAKA